MKTISVVIPNYNGRKLLEENLPSVFLALKKINVDFEIIVADDASKDDSVVFLEEKYPQIIIIKNLVNIGFSANINSGLKKAKKDLIFALNSDVKLTDDYFVHQLKYFNESNTFGVMGSLLDPKTNKITDTAKYPEQSFFGIIKSTRNVYCGEQGIPTLFVSGANALMDRKKLLQINYFNELFSPFYGEDVDLGIRSWRMGWKSLYEPKSICFHEASSTILSTHKKNKIKNISRRNKFTFHDLHLESTKRFLFFLKVGIDLLVRWLVLDFGYYKSFFGYLQMRSKINSYKNTFNKLNPKYNTQDILNKIHSEFSKFKLKFLN